VRERSRIAARLSAGLLVGLLLCGEPLGGPAASRHHHAEGPRLHTHSHVHAGPHTHDRDHRGDPGSGQDGGREDRDEPRGRYVPAAGSAVAAPPSAPLGVVPPRLGPARQDRSPAFKPPAAVPLGTSPRGPPDPLESHTPA
jgi:hypothetical protein